MPKRLIGTHSRGCMARKAMEHWNGRWLDALLDVLGTPSPARESLRC
jgi:hypothetical protein